MKTLAVFLALVMVGCTAVNTTPGNEQGVASRPQTATPPTRSTAGNNSARLIVPATGGAPVMAIPIGGNLYLPVTGGAPIPGIPVTPK